MKVRQGRAFAVLAAAFLAIIVQAAAWAQGGTSQAPAAPAEDPAGHVYVSLVTEAGVITLGLDAAHAPLTTANFLKYVDKKMLDGTTFYRAMHLDSGEGPAGLLQGGLRSDPAKVLPPVSHEPTSATGILHKAGTISMARYAPGTATADFTIMISDMPGLDARADAQDPESRAGFAAFGHVIAGMDVVRKIWDMPRSPTAGEGVMKGDMLERPVRILSVRRFAAPPAVPAPVPAASAEAEPGGH